MFGGFKHVFSYIGNFIIPTDELHHFSEGWLNRQPVEFGACLFPENHLDISCGPGITHVGGAIEIPSSTKLAASQNISLVKCG